MILLKKFKLKKNNPFFKFSSNRLESNIRMFKNYFPGTLIFSVKANPSNLVLKIMKDNGVNYFDVASIKEVKVVKSLFKDVRLFFMNTVKSRQSIREAYIKYNVKDFSLDTSDELYKILEETNYAKDLNLHLRLAITNKFSQISLSEKFGAKYREAIEILDQMKKIQCKIGISFHTGSQCLNPKAYIDAMKVAKKVIRKSNIDLDYFNVGGGFPAKYPGSNILPLNEYFMIIKNEFKKLDLSKDVKLLAEPGRCLVSDSMSLNVRVNLRKDNFLYINDGIHGSLHDAGKYKFKHSVTISSRKVRDKKLVPFSFYGPTCDSSDFIEGPFLLPNCIREGDWIEIQEMGAYSTTMQSDFNGFYSEREIFVED